MSVASTELLTDVAETNEPTNEIRFADLGLSAPLLAAVESSGYTIATPIQARAIPLLLEGRDVLGQAQTGTGKTAAFALPLLERIDLEQDVPQVLVLTPTRELAIQVAEAFERYARGMKGLRAVAIYGGQDYQVQFRQLDRGVHVVVGTPGRVMDHMRRGSLKLDTLQALVLDEADEMLRMGFAEDVEWVLTQTPAERQIALFSATMPEEIRAIAQQHLNDPAEIAIQERSSAADTVRQRFLAVPPPQKQAVLARILEAEPTDGVIVFVKTKSTTEHLAQYLADQGYRVAALSSDVVQKTRERIVDNLRAGRIDIIVATDVAARGLDVQRISHVINYDFPFDSESYVHRIGRTGRAGRTGDAILLLGTRDRHLLRRLERATGQPIELMEIPSKRAINQRRVARFHERITAALTRPDLDKFQSVVEQFRAKNPETPIEQVAAALATMAVGDVPLFVTEELSQSGFRESAGFRESRGFRDEGRSRFGDRRDERGSRGGDSRERGPRERAAGPMETYRIEVGKVHGAKPGNIVGAIANEAGIPGGLIGRIELGDDHSFIDMCEGMSEATFQALKKVVVAGRPLGISKADRGEARPARAAFDKHDRAPSKRPAYAKAHGKSKGFKPRKFKSKD